MILFLKYINFTRHVFYYQGFTWWYGTDTLCTESGGQCWTLSNLGRFPGTHNQ